jgi:hypothetical protein
MTSTTQKPVLVIEDSAHHQAAACAQLPDAIVVNYDEAFRLLRDTSAREKYAAVLTDLFFLVEKDRVIDPAPFSKAHYPQNCAMIGTEQPFGMFFAMKGRELGLPTAVVTNGNHHSNLFIGLLDMFGRMISRDEYAVKPELGDWVSIPDPGFSILYESQYPTAKDMYWDESLEKLVMSSAAAICEEQDRAWLALPSDEGVKTEVHHGWKYVKDWRVALATVLREKEEYWG